MNEINFTKNLKKEITEDTEFKILSNELHEKMKKWYSKSEVIFEIVKGTYKKETSFLIPSWCPKELKKCSTRMLKCHNHRHFDFLIGCTSMYRFKRPYNIYYSVATYENGIPNQPVRLYNRDNSEWTKNHYKQMISYDYFIDIDCDTIKNMDLCFESAKALSILFDDLNTPHEIRFSGRGFHFIIPHHVLPKKSLNPNDNDNLYKLLAFYTEKLYEQLSEMIDVSIYDSRRLCKVPFTLSLYEDNAYVCYPFQSKEEFNNFNIDDFKVNNFNKDIKNKGKFIFNVEGNLNKFIEYINNIDKIIMDLIKKNVSEDEKEWLYEHEKNCREALENDGNINE